MVEGNAPTLSGDVSLDGAAKQVTATNGIGTSSIETGNESRDKKMKAEVLDVTTHKTIAYKVESIAGDADKLFAKSPATLSLKGKLTLLSKEHPLDATATAKYEGDALVVDGKAQIDMDVWQVPDMSGMLLKVKRKIDVEFHIVAAP
ncbi:MAG: YceI family protein [Acidobacteriota bacterium]